jgi:AcrR family transcriptional regulator
LHVKQKRLTRRESQDSTRERLIEAARKAFVRDGFDAASVERIAEGAGFSRGAFYSNFRSKDEILIAVLQAERREIERALGEIVRIEDDPARRLQAVLQWFVNLKVKQAGTILETEFMLRAMRNRAARARMAEFNRQRLSDYAALAARHFAESGEAQTAQPEVIALALFALSNGLDSLELLERGDEHRGLYAECRDLVFRSLIPGGGKTEQER